MSGEGILPAKGVARHWGDLGDAFLAGRAEERRDVLAHLARRHGNAARRCSRDYGGGEEQARIVACECAVLHGNIRTGLHEGDGEILPVELGGDVAGFDLDLPVDEPGSSLLLAVFGGLAALAGFAAGFGLGMELLGAGSI